MFLVTLINKCPTGFNSSTTKNELSKETTIMIININTLIIKITQIIIITNTIIIITIIINITKKKKKKDPNLERIIYYHMLPQFLIV